MLYDAFNQLDFLVLAPKNLSNVSSYSKTICNILIVYDIGVLSIFCLVVLHFCQKNTPTSTKLIRIPVRKTFKNFTPLVSVDHQELKQLFILFRAPLFIFLFSCKTSWNIFIIYDTVVMCIFCRVLLNFCQKKFRTLISWLMILFRDTSTYFAPIISMVFHTNEYLYIFFLTPPFSCPWR
jgi:hypothetical protein